MLTESSPSSGSGETPKLRTACENCRQSKVKCNLSGKDTCIRCLRHGLPCRYRVANRSGKPKGSKNRSTLRKLGQLQESKAAFAQNDRPPKRSIEAMSPFTRSDTDTSLHTEKLSESPMEVPDASAFLADCTEYPSLYGDSITDSITDSPCDSMSPTFLQKEFITKGLTSFPLAVHIPSAVRPTCDCAETLVFYHDHLRQMVVNSAQLRFDQMLQGVQAALSVCRGFLQCPSGHGHGQRDNSTNDTSLILCMSTLELALQLLNYWTSYELLQQPREREAVGYGEYEMGPDETRRVRRFLIRGRLLFCKETLGLLKSAAGFEDGLGGTWLHQIIGGSEAMTDTFLHAISEAECICTLPAPALST